MRLPLLLACALIAMAPAAQAADVAASAPAASARFVEIPATAATLDEARRGGFVLYLRHGSTDNSRADLFPGLDLADCATQRVLTEDGRRMATRVGKAMHKARLPVAEIRVSPLCRTRDTAALAFPGQAAEVDPNLMYTANLTSSEKAPILAKTRELLSTPVAAGGNRLIIAHGPNLMDLIGYFPKEGTLVIFRPQGGRANGTFRYVASVAPGAWPDLLSRAAE